MFFITHLTHFLNSSFLLLGIPWIRYFLTFHFISFHFISVHFCSFLFISLTTAFPYSLPTTFSTSIVSIVGYTQLHFLTFIPILSHHPHHPHHSQSSSRSRSFISRTRTRTRTRTRRWMDQGEHVFKQMYLTFMVLDQGQDQCQGQDQDQHLKMSTLITWQIHFDHFCFLLSSFHNNQVKSNQFTHNHHLLQNLTQSINEWINQWRKEGNEDGMWEM